MIGARSFRRLTANAYLPDSVSKRRYSLGTRALLRSWNCRALEDHVDYQFTVIPSSTHLHAIGSGTHSPENLRRFLAETYRAVLARQCTAVLLEVRFSGPSLDLANLYAIIQDNRADASTMKRIAYVDTDTQRLPERAEFVELAANRLGLNARFFRNVIDAEHWLQAAERASVE